ncbi:MAG: DNA polymerase III subunit epsilon [Alphaproteobacteria bacterium]|jgi:DNA polymerase-3 subunit epsilon|nr:DNA polymerase III subunit epsilon [Candidatus Jidaibacter sp.]
MLREIVLDTETTGLYAKNGDRIVEIGCVELVNRVRTYNDFHVYVNPQRDMPDEAFRIHGISSDFLKDKPPFPKVANDFVQYIQNSQLIIHNANFDVNFLNYELALCGMRDIIFGRVTDTLILSRKKFPGAPASLDALCRRFNISLESRQKHGALLDAELLSQVYIELMGGTQAAMELHSKAMNAEDAALQRKNREYRSFAVPQADFTKHEEFVSKIPNKLWS